MKIYFAHSIQDYNSQIEREALKILKNRFPNDKITNPRQFPDLPFDKYLQIVRKHNTLCFMGLHGKRKVTCGVKQEMITAQKSKLPIYKIQNNKILKVTENINHFPSYSLDETKTLLLKGYDLI
jgi:hypothetical protein